MLAAVLQCLGPALHAGRCSAARLLVYHTHAHTTHTTNTPAGKSTLSKQLLNWAVRSGWEPTFVDLDVGECLLPVRHLLMF